MAGRGWPLLSLVQVDSPALIWPVLEEALSRVKDKTGERWTPPFVLDRILNGQAGLFEFRDGEHLGWVVVELCRQGELPWMNVWILEGDGLEKHEEAMPLIDKLAREVGASAWRATGRKGWQRIGLKPIATVYERVLL